jgi:hypothetical protein
MMRQLGILLGSMAVLWLLLALPARWIWGDVVLLHSVVALSLCALPAAASLAWANVGLKHSPEMLMFQVLGATGLRMAFVLGVGLALYLGLPDHFSEVFWVWVLVFYMFSLFVEVCLVVRAKRLSQKGPDPLANRALNQEPANDAVGGHQSV